MPLALCNSVNKFALPMQCRWYPYFTKARSYLVERGKILRISSLTSDSFWGRHLSPFMAHVLRAVELCHLESLVGGQVYRVDAKVRVR